MSRSKYIRHEDAILSQIAFIAAEAEAAEGKKLRARKLLVASSRLDPTNRNPRNSLRRMARAKKEK